MTKHWRRALAALAALALPLAAWLWHVNYNDGVDIGGAAAAVPADPALLPRGAYLARTGNCLACHTARGGPLAAGGRPVATPFGTVYASNLTPDLDTGLGRWSAAAFWRALHHGRSADGRLLVPVFPYTHTTLLTRADSDALYAYFQSLPPTRGRPPAHALRWPYGSQAALAVWRALYFRPGSYQPEPARGDAWNRGAYLVRAVAHCSACHATRDALGGADWQSLGGARLPAQGWYAPSLLDAREAGVADWPEEDIARLLKTGVAERGSASGPMAEVVMHGTQHLSDDDLAAMATYLKSLPQQPVPAASDTPGAPRHRSTGAGEKLYEQHCASCHGTQGEGVAGAYPPLAGNRAITLRPIDNLLQAVLFGGFNAATAGHPRPYGMPPFTLTLGDADIAALLSYIRTRWGNQAPEVSPLDVHTLRAAM
ncbi:cytochrome c [Ottowia sp.]|uniref:c-type cytochrome n=1 Tax=Ottowia sp. TaxID=1898956 RepID=UPI0025E1B5AE|nr:cytochrome c [Ottowia sp.]MBK6613501.1 cytochrome c [Ottowia sp.]